MPQAATAVLGRLPGGFGIYLAIHPMCELWAGPGAGLMPAWLLPVAIAAVGARIRAAAAAAGTTPRLTARRSVNMALLSKDIPAGWLTEFSSAMPSSSLRRLTPRGP